MDGELIVNLEHDVDDGGVIFAEGRKCRIWMDLACAF